MANLQTPAFALGDISFAVCQVVESFIGDSVRPILSRLEVRTPAIETYDGAVIRVHGWLRSLIKLNHPGDFQAILTGSRALFEIAVDLTLLRFDPACSCEKLLAWEDSAKLHAAERLARYCAEPLALKPTGATEALKYLEQRDRVVRERQRHWSIPKHPQRWTNRTLDADASAADRHAPSGFAEYYNARYPQICWNVHGSGLAGVRFLPAHEFPALSAFGFSEAAGFALIASRRALELVDRWDAISGERFRLLEEKIDATRVAVWEAHGAPRARNGNAG